MFAVLAATGVLFLVVHLLWPAPAGVIVQGLIVGSLTALIAFGVSLIYRANHVINFAQADLGVVPAALAVALMSVTGVSFWLAAPAALATALVLGFVVERLFVRRFAKAPRLILMVVTIGLAQILAGLGAAVPIMFGRPILSDRFQPPFDFSLRISPITFHANDLLAVLTVAAAATTLFGLLRFTRIGIAIRASAQSADRAALLGVNVARIQSVVWMIAAVLATVATLLRAGILGLPFGTAFGPGLLLRALTACVVARMENFAVMFGVSVGLGVLENSILWDKGSDALLAPAMFVLVLLILLLQRRRRESRVDDQNTSSWGAIAAVRPIPQELAGLPEVRWGLRGVRLALAAGLVVLPAILSVGHTSLATVLLIYAILAVSLVILVGWAGEISLGHVAFLGIGAAISATLNVHYHWDLLATVAVAGVAGALSALLVGLPALRIRGLFLAVSTLAFALLTSQFLLNRDYIHFLPDDITQPVSRLPLLGKLGIGGERSMYFVCLAALGFILWTARGLQGSRTFRVLVAARDNERAAQSYGVNISQTKLAAFAISGFFASFAGGLLAIQQQAVGQTVFDPVESIRVLTAAVVGGLGSIPGALAGMVFVKSTEWFDILVPTQFRFLFKFAGTGVGLVFVLMMLPNGLGGLLYRYRDRWLERVAARRQIVVPSLLADAQSLDSVSKDRRPGVLPFWWNRPQPAPFLRSHPRLLSLVTRHEPNRRYRTAVVMNVVNLLVITPAIGFLLAYFVNPGLVVPQIPNFCFYLLNQYHLHRHRDRFLERAERTAVLARTVREQKHALTQTDDAGSEGPLLTMRDVNVSYGPVQVLFNVNLDITAGQVVALLGTNGAGKSTVLRAISGLATPDNGRIRFGGFDITGMDPARVAGVGICQAPGGKGVFPALTVAENLSVACWQIRHDAVSARHATDRMLDLFPVLREKLTVPAATLSGGQQQMLTLAMALITRPRLLMIDELSLGLAPVVVEQLLAVIGKLRDEGTTIILVEQSVNVALTVADVAYFMEKGEIKFHGPTAELLDRPDLLRAVYLTGAGAQSNKVPPRPRAPRTTRPSFADRPVVLSTDDLRKAFAGVTAISHVSLDLHEGEILGIIGPNGAGKTTLFDLICGYLSPDEGAVQLSGLDVTGLRPDQRSRLGLVRSFQDARLFAGLTVRQAIAVALDQRHAIKDPIAAAFHLPDVERSEAALAARVDELIELMELAAFRDKFVGELSTGSRRIVDLACVMATQPKVILFDEPSSGIAQREAEALGPLLQQIRRETQASLIVIEHDMPLITAMADRMIALDLGAVVADGDAKSVLNNPHVVSSYLGSRSDVVQRSGRAARGRRDLARSRG